MGRQGVSEELAAALRWSRCSRAPPPPPPRLNCSRESAAMCAMLCSTVFLVKGLREFTAKGYERAARSFDDAVMQRSLAGRRAMVTGAPLPSVAAAAAMCRWPLADHTHGDHMRGPVAGANQGLGFQTSLELARRGATLYMVGAGVAAAGACSLPPARGTPAGRPRPAVSPRRAAANPPPPALLGAYSAAARRRCAATISAAGRRWSVCGRTAATLTCTSRRVPVPLPAGGPAALSCAPLSGAARTRPEPRPPRASTALFPCRCRRRRRCATWHLWPPSASWRRSMWPAGSP